MSSSSPARRTIHRTPIRRGRVAGVLVVVAVAAALGDHALSSSSPTALSPVDVPHGERRIPRGEDRGAPGGAVPDGTTAQGLGEADGAVPDGTTVFDGAVAGVANLDPALLGALHEAGRDAADDGVAFLVESGWRSAEYQRRLLQRAVSKYGSEEEAARWVATPDTSAHVSGDAVDLGPSDAMAWLSEHGAEYGLCQTYRNEPWHYELRPEAPDQGCPPPYADPTQDPRLQR